VIARELISPGIPCLTCSDTGQKAINIMESVRVSHLPLLNGTEYLGLISDKDVYDRNLEQGELGAQNIPLARPYIKANQHIYEVARLMLDLRLSLIPVLEMNNEYAGSITIHDLSLQLIDLVTVNDPGAVIVLALHPNDYSLSQIAQIVESNNAKILSLYTKSPENSIEMDVTLKVNLSDISSIIQTFVRYDYNIKAVYMDASLIHDMYSERYELFMKYMNF
jgi:CBS domain-containing protein